MTIRLLVSQILVAVMCQQVALAANQVQKELQAQVVGLNILECLLQGIDHTSLHWLKGGLCQEDQLTNIKHNMISKE